MDLLDLNVRRCLLSSLSPSTLVTYRTGYRCYRLFCTQAAHRAFPLNEFVLQRFVVSVANRLAFKTIKVYLSGLQFFSILIGSNIRIASFPRLYYVLRGIRRLQGDRFRRPRRLPITFQHLLVLSHRISCQRYSAFESLMLRSACALAFFGLLRCSEYTSPRRRSYDADATLLVQDISFNSDYTLMYVHIKASKTDPFRTGCTIRVAAVGGIVCPVLLLRSYLRCHPTGSGPLFLWRSGHFLIRNDIVLLLRRCFPNKINLNTHSFRIGGASAAASAGVSDNHIQILGRWSSDAYRRYIHASDELVFQLGRALSSGSPSTRVWDSLSGGSVPFLG